MPNPSRSVRLGEIQEAVGGVLHGAGDTSLSGASSLEDAGPQDLCFIAADRFVEAATRSSAGAFIVGQHLPALARPQLVVANPAYAFAQTVERFFAPQPNRRGIASQLASGTDVRIGPDATIWPNVTLGDRVTLGARVTLYPGVFIGDDATVGDDTVLFPNVAVMDRCRIGNRVRIHGGTVIGSDGFGYVQHEGRHHKVPQIGIVVVEDDVEIGANAAVDRATFGQTVIKRGTKIDNLVQVAHNVTVGEHSILVAQVGIAGSTQLGHHVVLGGQAGVGDHLTIGDGAMVAARSGVSKHVPAGEIVSGNPAIPHMTSLRAHSLFPSLPELKQQVRDLERRLAALERGEKKGLRTKS